MSYAFTDRHGITYTAAVVEFTELRAFRQTERMVIPSDSSSTSAQLHYRLQYWKDQAAKDAGLDPLPFVGEHGSDYITFPLANALDIETADLVAEALEHFETVELLALQ